MEQTVDGIINKYTCVKSDKEQKLLDKLDIAEEKLNESVTKNKELKSQLIVLKNQLDTAHSEVEKVHEKQEKIFLFLLYCSILGTEKLVSKVFYQ